MANCNYCGDDAGYLSSICPSCRLSRTGREQPTAPQRAKGNPFAMSPSTRDGRTPPWLWAGLFVAVIVILFAVVMYAGNTPQAEEKGLKRLAIEQCWKDYERKSLDPGTKRFVASVCEKLELDFETQYNVKP